LATRLALSGAHVVTAGSQHLLDSVQSHRRANTDLTPLGVDLALFAPSDQETRGSRSRTVLFAGSLTAVKDPVSMVRAFARVASNVPDVRLAIVGDGPLRAGLERLAQVLDVGDRVEFEGRIPRTRLIERYRSSTVLLMASRHEAQSMVACEAAACGTPVVGTSVGVVPELAHAGGGVSVAVGDVAGLARAIESVLRDPAARTRMGSAARAYAEQSWNVDRTVAAWENLYRELMRSGGTRLTGVARAQDA
jgi:glycosyltransferase involved in cell wall biosynthesis